MTNENYRKGADKERELRNRLRDEGHYADRVAGSGSMDGPSCDVIAFIDGEPYLIECKVANHLGKVNLKNSELVNSEACKDMSGAKYLFAVEYGKLWNVIERSDIDGNKLHAERMVELWRFLKT